MSHGDTWKVSQCPGTGCNWESRDACYEGALDGGHVRSGERGPRGQPGKGATGEPGWRFQGLADREGG